MVELRRNKGLLALLLAPLLGGAGIATAETACFARDYTQDHMARDSAQRVDSLRLLFDGNARNSQKIGVVAQVAAKFRDDQSQFLTEYLICDPDGPRAWCAVECDGGGMAITWEGRDLITLTTRGFNVDAECGRGTNTRNVRDAGGGVTVFKLRRTGPAACEGMKLIKQN